MKLKHFFLLLAILTLLTACNKNGKIRYGKILKSKNIPFKYGHAVNFYEEEEYYKALPIFDELIGLVRGDTLYEDVYYYYAKTNYAINDFYLANYYAKNFARTFSNSPRAEELLFLSAMSSYKNSPNYSLDQQSTELAIDEFQYFLDTYPSSVYKDSCENIMLRLSYKLEKKAVEIAKLYVTTKKYKSGTIAIETVLDKYPDSQFREELYSLRIKTWFQYAAASIESKKRERFTECIKSYTTFVAAFPESNLMEEANNYNEKATAELKKLNGE